MNDLYDIALSFATEEQALVEQVYHYLKAEGICPFFAPAPECQIVLSGRNQREVFYEIFGMSAKYVALFVSKNYVKREVPMEEAAIAFSKHGDNGSVIPVYLDGTALPKKLFDPKSANYFASEDPAKIAAHLAAKIRSDTNSDKNIRREQQGGAAKIESDGCVMSISDICAKNVVQINKFKGDINF